MVDITTATRREDRDKFRALGLRQQLAQSERHVGREHLTADIVEVDGVIDIGGDRPPVGRLEVGDRDVGIDGPRRLEDLGVFLAGVPADGPVHHVKTPVEGDR